MAFQKKAAFDFLRRAHAQGRLAHAYLITGPAGSGKRALAAELSGLVTAADHPLRHPDVHIAEPESKSRRIVIEQIRGLEQALQMRASGSGKKVAVIFDADRLQMQAANAFLKTLEEPPENSLLLLTSDQPEGLPETILSRCITVPLTRAGPPELTARQIELLDALQNFFAQAQGDVAAVYTLVRKFTVLLQQAREEIAGENAGELKKEESAYRQATAGEWLDDREDFYKALTESRYVQQRFLLLETVVQCWADVLRQQQGFAALDLPACAAVTRQVAGHYSTAQILQRLGHLEQLRENLGRNVREDLAVEVAFLKTFAD